MELTHGGQKWEIGAGDSLRQKIDAGIGNCSHFIVLLTPTSIKKPWVNQEIDVGLIRKLQNKCKLIPLRHGLPAGTLPPLLSGLLSPEIDSASDLTQLIADIHGLQRKPPLGPAPAATKLPMSGYSPAVMTIAEKFCNQSTSGRFGDVQTSVDQISREAGLSVEDVRDALHEIQSLMNMHLDRVMPKNEFYAEFDGYFMDWRPAEDALRLAADLYNDQTFPHQPDQIAERYGWQPRRMNPAITFLVQRDAVRALEGAGSRYVAFRITPTDSTRRFVRSRS